MIKNINYKKINKNNNKYLKKNIKNNNEIQNKKSIFNIKIITQNNLKITSKLHN